MCVSLSSTPAHLTGKPYTDFVEQAILRPLAGAAVWYLYDAEFALLDWGLGKGAVGAVAGGSYLLLHGAPCTTITLTVDVEQVVVLNRV